MDEKRLEEKYELFRELEKYNLEKCLFEKFQKKNVRVHILWKLDDKDLDFVGLNRIEKREYKEAKKRRISKDKAIYAISSFYLSSLGMKQPSLF